ncbi:peptidoglycan recognition protein [Streptomyces oceani]|uniref:N-acetylmuramoyl-L-alanine amidase n=1 Tax=Streptomyces oceani TaxID=1075402 RepID=A0A1E7KPG2_9ACTN|nr:N-acetylmuramoyl-L-alanine amidase [Streptomyces oceani]OEV05784.1 N-acetylmuramoyl-L-alanine amidase [Streptomyces oceani]
MSRLSRTALVLAALPLAVMLRWESPARPGNTDEPTETTRPATAPRPRLVERDAWHADEGLVREAPKYLPEVRAVFVHHTNHPADYDCADVPRMLRALESAHVRAKGWDDVGYQYVVDRCGTVYEGRGGGDAERTVRGAHTKGFNRTTVGIAALGDFSAGEPVPRAMLDAIAAVAAWKLPPDADPHGAVWLRSTNDESRFDERSRARFPVITGHRDAFETDCPGDALYAELPLLRDEVARLRAQATAASAASTD